MDACVPGHRVTTHGLTACSIDISTVGNYTVSFFLSDASLSPSSAVVSRTVVVHPDCAQSETLCSDNICSTGGFCFGGAPTEQKTNSAPTLAFNPMEQQTVYIPRGRPYTFCSSTTDDPNSLSGSASGDLCESGPVATDDEDGVLTDRVLACPPADCLSYGCPGHELQTKGLAGCGVDTVNAPVGTVFNLTFSVFDLNRPAASASLFRLVGVTSPCAQNELYCPDSAVQCADAPCNLRSALEEAEVALASPPEFVVDLSGVPTDIAQLVSGSSTYPTLSIRGMCGSPLPVDFTNICSELGPAQKPTGQQLWRSQLCKTGTDPCTVSVQQEVSTGTVPTVTIIREERACDQDSVSGCNKATQHCSLAAVAAGHCSPSLQRFTMHALHEQSSDSPGSVLQQMSVDAMVLSVVANAAVVVHANVSADSPQHAQHMPSLEGQSVGTEKCSFVAAAVHQFVAQHVQSAPACSSLASESASAASSPSGHIALSVEVMVTQHVQSDIAGDAESAAQGNLTTIGSLELQAVFTIGADISNLNPGEDVTSSVVHVAAVACLDALQGKVLRLAGNEPESVAGVKLPLQLLTGVQPLLVMASLDVESVAAQAAQCPQQSAEQVSIDEMTAAIEDAEMQQHLHEKAAWVCSVLT